MLLAENIKALHTCLWLKRFSVQRQGSKHDRKNPE